MEVDGVYRKSGPLTQVNMLIQIFACGQSPDLMSPESDYQDVTSITSVLKHYLRSLPQPLLTYELYSHFMDAIST
jgi:hypothetical protein